MTRPTPASGTPGLRINRVLRVMLHARWSAETDGDDDTRAPESRVRRHDEPDIRRAERVNVKRAMAEEDKR
jgi:hypothetical protein